MTQDLTTHTEDYRGYTISIIHDQFCSNPFEEWDCEPPLIIASLDMGRMHTSEYGLSLSVPTLTTKAARAISKTISTIGDHDCKTALRFINEYAPSYLTNYSDGTAALEDALSGHMEHLSTSDKMEFLCAIYNAMDIPAKCEARTGYSQGAYIEVLAVATPEWQKKAGCDTADIIDSNLKAAINLAGYWAFGDVYGFEITDPDGHEFEDNACWGFYGDYPDFGGAIQQAKEAIDHEIEYRAEQAKQQALIQQCVNAN